MSNDYTYHKQLADAGKIVIVLDHHLADKVSAHAIVINNQMSDYPNKDFSGAGITWQFCRYLDELMNKNISENYYDLLALGNCGDMMSQLSLETKYLIDKGFSPDYVKNPFIYSMWKKNEYKLGEKITPMGAAFYIVPFVNAICRSGTLEEKELIFNSMLNHKAFIQVPSTKRGHKAGETERIVDQAIRTCTNVKNRQTRAQDEGMKKLEQKIIDDNLLRHKVLLFLLEPGEIPGEIRGLIANKFMAKYQRPCCILTKTYDPSDIPPWEVEVDPSSWSYQGSARGYDKSGITNFKSICDNTGAVLYTAGHEGAFGIGIDSTMVDEFLAATDIALQGLSAEPIYYVDYEFSQTDRFGDKVLDVANMADYWGKDFDEAIICVKGIHIKEDNFKVMKSNTLKISLPNKIDIIKFRGTESEINALTEKDIIEINAICYCRKNEWRWEVNPQLELIDYEIVDKGENQYGWFGLF